MSCGTCGDNKQSEGTKQTQAAGGGGAMTGSTPQQHCPDCGWFMTREGQCTNPKCKTGREILKGCARTYVNQSVDDEGLDWWDVDKDDGTLILQRVDDEQPERIPLSEWYSPDLPSAPRPKVGRLFEPDPAELANAVTAADDIDAFLDKCNAAIADGGLQRRPVRLVVADNDGVCSVRLEYAPDSIAGTLNITGSSWTDAHDDLVDTLRDELAFTYGCTFVEDWKGYVPEPDPVEQQLEDAIASLQASGYDLEHQGDGRFRLFVDEPLPDGVYQRENGRFYMELSAADVALMAQDLQEADLPASGFNPRKDGHPDLKRLFDAATAEFDRFHLLYDDQGRLRDDPATCQDVADGLMVCMARELAETFDPDDPSPTETAVNALERLWVDVRSVASNMPDDDPGSLLAVLDAATLGYDDVALYHYEGNLSPEADTDQTLGAIIACELAQTYSPGDEYESNEIVDRMAADVERVLRSIERLDGE